MKALAATLVVVIALGALFLTGCSNNNETRMEPRESPQIYATPTQESSDTSYTDNGWADLYYTP